MSGRPIRRVRRPPGAAASSGSPGALADLVDLVGGESERSRRFLGGLVAGALLGAAVVGTAGAAIVRRHRAPGTGPGDRTSGAGRARR